MYTTRRSASRSLEINVLVDGDADVSQYEPRKIDGGKKEKQCKLRGPPDRFAGPRQHRGKADGREHGDGQRVEQRYGIRLRANAKRAFTGEVVLAHSYEQDLRQAEVEQPHRYTDGADQNEQ